MTDLEMTKLCAKEIVIDYCPLHDDAQAMALVKKFKLDIEPQDALWMVSVWNEENVRCHHSYSESLNRAIVECVVKLQGANHG